MSADTLTILRCERGHRAAKLVRTCQGGDGATATVVDNGDLGTWFSVHLRPVSSLATLAATLERIALDPRSFVIRGSPLPEADLSRCRRLLHPQADGTAPTFGEAARRWLLLDCDTAELPGMWDWRDGDLSALSLRAKLPPDFQGASLWWQFTAGAGFKPGLRMRLAFWLDRPVTGEELRRWLAAAPVDHAVFCPVQPIYCANPILRGGAEDPVLRRSGVEPGERDEVPVPALEPPAEPERPEAPRRYATGRGWPLAELEEAARAVATTPPAGTNRWGHAGRHSALYCASLRVSRLIAEGFLAADGTLRVLAAAARHAGIGDHEAARTIRNAFRQGGLPV